MQKSLNNGNDPSCDGGDFDMRCLLFWGLFLPLGEVFSVDAALSDRHKKRRHGVEEWMVLNAATVSLIFQIAVMYITSFYEKTAPEWHPDGTATFLALKNDFLARGMAHVLLLLPMWLLRILTLSVLYWEGLGPFLFISPKATAFCRTLAAAGFAAMHAGFWSCLRLDMFGPVTMSAVLCLLPTAFWDLLASLSKRRAVSATRVEYDGGCQFCSGLMRLADTMLLVPRAEFSSTKTVRAKGFDGDFSWSDFESDDRAAAGAMWTVEYAGSRRGDLEGLGLLLRASPIAWPMAPLVAKIGGSAVAQRLFKEFVHDHDSAAEVDSEYGRAAAAESISNPRRPRRVHASFRGLAKLKTFAYYAGQVYCGVMGVLVVGWMWSNIPGWPMLSLTDPTLRQAVLAVQMDQAWGMFAPRPQSNHWFYIMEGNLVNGSKVELWGEGGMFHWQGRPFTWDKPSLYNSMRVRPSPAASV
eukprot:TRINITY_DN6480_c0_g2_i2.p1 TRINITY_DN6480_c0_g2~~TRINITY_DN6480_c0_g2_i2.p1  ORF type:complete len:469 (-),score=116.92 TRINITY_DN6480_c0_g2_i2:21-1427(-)